MVGMAQLVSAPDCGSGDPGFEPLYPPDERAPERVLFLHKIETSKTMTMLLLEPIKMLRNRQSGFLRNLELI